MRALDKKLVRDLRRMWAQALAIALVMGAGVATIVLAIGAYRSLEETRAAYYERYRFAEVFAEMTRAPDGVLDRVREIPGVLTAEARIKKTAIIDVEGFAAPVSGAVLSLPDHAEPLLTWLHMREGRVPEPDNAREVVIDEAFAAAHRLRPGSRFAAVLNGRKRELTVVGVALSPEFIYALGPGDLMPDNRRFGVLWMSRKALQAIFDLDGAFNDLALHLLPGTSEVEIIRRLDPILARYGSTGAYGRTEQQSHAFLDAELNQLAAMGRVIPPIFLFVSPSSST